VKFPSFIFMRQGKNAILAVTKKKELLLRDSNQNHSHAAPALPVRCAPGINKNGVVGEQ
jgi:hypothetical protein